MMRGDKSRHGSRLAAMAAFFCGCAVGEVEGGDDGPDEGVFIYGFRSTNSMSDGAVFTFATGSA